MNVSIHYKDGSTVEADTLDSAVNHVSATSSDDVVDVREDPPAAEPCKHCDGTGLQERAQGKRLLTKKQLEQRVREWES